MDTKYNIITLKSRKRVYLIVCSVINLCQFMYFFIAVTVTALR